MDADLPAFGALHRANIGLAGWNSPVVAWTILLVQEVPFVQLSPVSLTCSASVLLHCVALKDCRNNKTARTAEVGACGRLRVDAKVGGTCSSIREGEHG